MRSDCRNVGRAGVCPFFTYGTFAASSFGSLLQPQPNHDTTILRVESKNDFDTTIPHSRFSKSDNIELHGLGSSINCLGRRVTSYTTRGAKEIARLLAVLP